MGFVSINKIFTIEEIFSMYNSNGGEKIDKADIENAKNIKIFEGFKIEEGWTLEDFERENTETYKRYEGINTELHSPEYQQASFPEKLQKFAELFKRYHPEEADDLDQKIEEIAKNAEQKEEYTFANFLIDVEKKQVHFGLDK